MFGLETLDLIIGLVTVYLAFGIATTASVEAVSSVLKLRAKNLEAALGEMLSGSIAENEKLIEKVYKNPLVETLSQGKNGRPSYIPKSIVSQVVESLVIAKSTTESISNAIEKMPDKVYNVYPNRVKALFEEFDKRANGDIEKFKDNLEEHFDRVMERSTGWYKRKVQLITLIISTVLVVGGNVDTIEIAKTLSTNPEARAQMVAAPTDLAQSGPPIQLPDKNPSSALDDTGSSSEKNDDSLKTTYQTVSDANQAYLSILEALRTTETASVQIGWNVSNRPDNFLEWISKFFGLLVSAFAVSLGAPFWFNVLQKLAQLRSTGTPQTTEKNDNKPTLTRTMSPGNRKRTKELEEIMGDDDRKPEAAKGCIKGKTLAIVRDEMRSEIKSIYVWLQTPGNREKLIAEVTRQFRTDEYLAWLQTASTDNQKKLMGVLDIPAQTEAQLEERRQRRLREFEGIMEELNKMFEAAKGYIAGTMLATVKAEIRSEYNNLPPQVQERIMAEFVAAKPDGVTSIDDVDNMTKDELASGLAGILNAKKNNTDVGSKINFAFITDIDGAKY